jgi:hypothetical protein
MINKSSGQSHPGALCPECSHLSLWSVAPPAERRRSTGWSGSRGPGRGVQDPVAATPWGSGLPFRAERFLIACAPCSGAISDTTRTLVASQPGPARQVANFPSAPAPTRTGDLQVRSLTRGASTTHACPTIAKKSAPERHPERQTCGAVGRHIRCTFGARHSYRRGNHRHQRHIVSALPGQHERRRWANQWHQRHQRPSGPA